MAGLPWFIRGFEGFSPVLYPGLCSQGGYSRPEQSQPWGYTGGKGQEWQKGEKQVCYTFSHENESVCYSPRPCARVLSVAGFRDILSQISYAPWFILDHYSLPYYRGFAHSGNINLGVFVRHRNPGM